MEKSEQINELAISLSLAQGSMHAATKDSTNPYFKNKYASLASVIDSIRKPLADNGLSLTQHASVDGNIVTVETVILHKSGQWMSSNIKMNSKDVSAQGIGSTITYARRYSLSSILGIAAEEDDDGNASSKPEEKSQPAKTQVNPNYEKAAERFKSNSDEDLITSEQGSALMTFLAKGGHLREDLQQYIMFEWNIEKLADIKNKHILKIREHFANPKVKL